MCILDIWRTLFVSCYIPSSTCRCVLYYLHIGLGLDFVFVSLFRFSILRVFCVSLDYFVPMLLAFVVLGLVSFVPSQEIGWEEHLQTDLFCDKLDIKP